MKRNTFVIGLIVIFLLIISFFKLEDKYYDYRKYEEYKSPDGKYILVIYDAARLSPFTEYVFHGFSSQWSYRNAYAVLTDSTGEVLFEPSLFNRNRVPVCEINVDWYDDYVCVARGQYHIDL